MIGLAWATLAATAVAASASDCAAVRAALPAGGVCVAAGGGVAVAADEQAARALLDEAEVGERRFRAAFGREPARYAIYSYDDPAGAAATRATLRTLGFATFLPIPSPALLEQQRAEASSRLGASSGGSPVRVQRRDGGGGGEPRGPNLVPHELGHGWYTTAFWSDGTDATASTARPATMRYGSAGPDWLDEAAAMLMEDEAGARSYRQRFADGRSPGSQRSAAIPPELPLVELTSMSHPTMASLPASIGAAGPVQIRITGRPSLFYAQTRVFVDYLTERSGDARILAAVSEGLRGRSFDRWLAEKGSRHRLPTSLAAMQVDWDGWLDRRFGPSPEAR